MPHRTGTTFLAPVQRLRYDCAEFKTATRGVVNLADGDIHVLWPGLDFPETIQTFRYHLGEYAKRHDLGLATEAVSVFSKEVDHLEVAFSASDGALEAARKRFTQSANLRWDFARFVGEQGGEPCDLTDGKVWHLIRGTDYELDESRMCGWIKRYAEYFGLAVMVYTLRRYREDDPEGLQVVFAATDEAMPEKLGFPPRLRVVADPDRQAAAKRLARPVAPDAHQEARVAVADSGDATADDADPGDSADVAAQAMRPVALGANEAVRHAPPVEAADAAPEASAKS